MRISSAPIILIGFLSVGVALASYRFLLLGLDVAFEGMEVHIEARRTMFLLHVALAPVALAAGAFQFSSGIRRRMPTVHRWLGRIYVVSILISGLSGLVLALGSVERPFAAGGFGLLSIIWIGFTAHAVFLARSRRFVEHRAWMIRSFSLTFAAVTLRLQLVLMVGPLGMTYFEASSYLAWTSWVFNLLFAEWLVRRSPKPAQL